MVEEKVDFLVHEFLVKESRAKVVDYLVTLTPEIRGRFFVKNPRYAYDWTVFSRPLYENAWISVFIFSLVTPMAMVVVLFYRMLNIKFQKHKNYIFAN